MEQASFSRRRVQTRPLVIPTPVQPSASETQGPKLGPKPPKHKDKESRNGKNKKFKPHANQAMYSPINPTEPLQTPTDTKLRVSGSAAHGRSCCRHPETASPKRAQSHRPGYPQKRSGTPVLARYSPGHLRGFLLGFRASA